MGEENGVRVGGGSNSEGEGVLGRLGGVGEVCLMGAGGMLGLL